MIISGEITQRAAATVSAQLLGLAAESNADITVFINSQGGHVEAGDTLHDLVRFVSVTWKADGLLLAAWVRRARPVNPAGAARLRAAGRRSATRRWPRSGPARRRSPARPCPTRRAGN
ncbi:MAG: ATP-dependent Clp protease proteolytic subunit [Gemmatimonadales bacterium]